MARIVRPAIGIGCWTGTHPPRWDDPWIALGLRGPHGSYLSVWRRAPGSAANPAELALPVPHLRAARVSPEMLYPRHTGSAATWDRSAGLLTVTLPDPPSACVLRLA